MRLAADYTHVGGKGFGGTYLGSYLPGPGGYTFIPTTFDTSEGFNTAAANAYRRTVLGAPGFGFAEPRLVTLRAQPARLAALPAALASGSR